MNYKSLLLPVLVFYSHVANARTDLYCVNLGNFQAQRITNDDAIESRASWFQGSRSFTYSTNDGETSQLMKFSLEENKSAVIYSSSDAPVFDPAVSPIDSSIIFSQLHDGALRLFRKFEEQPPLPFLQNVLPGQHLFASSWSPSGEYLVFSAAEATTLNSIFCIYFSTTKEVRYIRPPTPYDAPLLPRMPTQRPEVLFESYYDPGYWQTTQYDIITGATQYMPEIGELHQNIAYGLPPLAFVPESGQGFMGTYRAIPGEDRACFAWKTPNEIKVLEPDPSQGVSRFTCPVPSPDRSTIALNTWPAANKIQAPVYLIQKRFYEKKIEGTAFLGAFMFGARGEIVVPPSNLRNPLLTVVMRARNGAIELHKGRAQIGSISENGDLKLGHTPAKSLAALDAFPSQLFAGKSEKMPTLTEGQIYAKGMDAPSGQQLKATCENWCVLLEHGFIYAPTSLQTPPESKVCARHEGNHLVYFWDTPAGEQVLFRVEPDFSVQFENWPFEMPLEAGKWPFGGEDKKPALHPEASIFMPSSPVLERVIKDKNGVIHLVPK